MNNLTTEALAVELGLKPQSLRAAVCRHQHYYGVRPTKLPNGRLLWPADSVRRLTEGTSAAPAGETGGAQ